MNSTQALSLVTFLAGFLIFSIGAVLKKIGTDTKLELIIQGIIVVIGFFVWGCTGILWIVRWEVPQIMPVKSKTAVTSGFLMVIVNWGIALYGIYLTLVRLFE